MSQITETLDKQLGLDKDVKLDIKPIPVIPTIADKLDVVESTAEPMGSKTYDIDTTPKGDVFGLGELDGTNIVEPTKLGLDEFDESTHRYAGQELFDKISEDREFSVDEKDAYVAMYLADRTGANYEAVDLSDSFATDFYGSDSLDDQFDAVQYKMQFQYGQTNIQKFDSSDNETKLKSAREWWDETTDGATIREDDLLVRYRKTVVANSAHNNLQADEANMSRNTNMLVDSIIGNESLTDDQYFRFSQLAPDQKKLALRSINIRNPKLSTGYAGRMGDALIDSSINAGGSFADGVRSFLGVSINEPYNVASKLADRGITVDAISKDGEFTEEGRQLIWDIRMEDSKGAPAAAQAIAYGQTKPSDGFMSAVYGQLQTEIQRKQDYDLDQVRIKRYANVEDDGIMGWIGELPILAVGVVPDLAVTIGGSMINPAIGIGYMFTRTHGGLETKLRYDYDVPTDQAFKMSIGASVAITAVEYFQVNKLLPKGGVKVLEKSIVGNKTSINKVLTKFVTENATLKSYASGAFEQGTQENIQSIIETATELTALFGYSKQTDGQKYEQAKESLIELLKTIPMNYGIMGIVQAGSTGINSGIAKVNRDKYNTIVADAILHGEIRTLEAFEAIAQGAGLAEASIKNSVLKSIQKGRLEDDTTAISPELQRYFDNISTTDIDDIKNKKDGLNKETTNSTDDMLDTGTTIEIEDAVYLNWDEAKDLAIKNDTTITDEFHGLLNGGKYSEGQVTQLIGELETRDATIKSLETDLPATKFEDNVDKLFAGTEITSTMDIDEVNTQVKSIIPDAKVEYTEDGNGLFVTLPSGANITIGLTDDISDKGAFIPYGNLIKLNNGTADANTVSHEVFHALETNVLSDADIAILEKQGLDDVEKRADAFMEYMNNGVTTNTIWDKIKAFFRKLIGRKDINDVYKKAREATASDVSTFTSTDVMLQKADASNTSLDRQHRASVASAYEVLIGKINESGIDEYLQTLSTKYSLNLNKRMRDNTAAQTLGLLKLFKESGDTISLDALYKTSIMMQSESVVKDRAPNSGLLPSQYVSKVVVPKTRKIVSDIYARRDLDVVAKPKLDPTDLSPIALLQSGEFDKTVYTKRLKNLAKSKELTEAEKKQVAELIEVMESIDGTIDTDSAVKAITGVYDKIADIYNKYEEILDADHHSEFWNIVGDLDIILEKDTQTDEDVSSLVDGISELVEYLSDAEDITFKKHEIKRLENYQTLLDNITPIMGKSIETNVTEYVNDVFARANELDSEKSNKIAIDTIKADLRKVISDSNIDSATKVRLRNAMKSLKTKKGAEGVIKRILQQVSVKQDKVSSKSLIRRIKNIVSSKKVRQSTKVKVEAHKREVDPTIAKRLDNMNRILNPKMTQELIIEEYSKLVHEINNNIVPDSVDDVDKYIEDLQDQLNDIILVGDLANQNRDTISETYKTIKEMVGAGVTKAQQVRETRATRIDKKVSTLLEGWKNKKTIKDKTGLIAKVGEMLDKHLSLEDVLDVLTIGTDRQSTDEMRKVTDKISKDNSDAYQQTLVDSYNMANDLNAILKEIYDEDSTKVIGDMDKPVEGSSKYRGSDSTGHVVKDGVDMTKGAIIQTYLTLVQEDYAWLLEDDYLPTQYKGNPDQYMEDLVNELTEEDVELVNWMQGSMDGQKAETIETSKKVLGIDPDLTKENYWPAKFVGDKAGLAEQHDTVNIVAGFLNPRVSHRRSIDNDANFVSSYMGAMEDSIRFNNYSEWIQETRGIFGKREVRKQIENKFGTRFETLLNEFITDVAKGRGRGEHNALMDSAVQTFATYKLGLNPSILVGQLASILSFPLHRKASIGDVASAFTEGNVKYMKNILNDPRIKARMTKGQTQIIADILEADASGKTVKMKQWLMKLNSWGDASAIAIGGSGIYGRSYKTEIAKGATEIEAHETAMGDLMLIVSATQQSSDIAHLSQWQRRGGSTGRAFGQFSNTVRQYLSKEIVAIKELIKLKDWASIKRAATVIGLNHALLPLVYTFIKRAYAYFAYDDEDNFWDSDESQRALASMITGPMGGLQFFDAFVEALATPISTSIVEGEVKKADEFGGSIVPSAGLFDDLGKLINLGTAPFRDDASVVDEGLDFLESAPAFKSLNRGIIERFTQTKREKKRKKKEKKQRD